MCQSLVKMLYIVHWMLLDSASECLDIEADRSGMTTPGDDTLNQYAFPLNCVQLFVYQFAPLIDTVKESDVVSCWNIKNTELFIICHI